jgi:hypothetical protein
MRKITLKCGSVILVDNDDYKELVKFKWLKTIHGYASSSLGAGRREYMHRLVLNAKPGQEIDHINGNKLDNRKENLRVVTRSQNARNMKPHKDGSSKYKGVYWDKTRKSFRVQVCSFGKRYYGGSFKDEKEAGRKYNELAIKIHGEYAYLNEVDQ